jgi:hypothetical protein
VAAVLNVLPASLSTSLNSRAHKSASFMLALLVTRKFLFQVEKPTAILIHRLHNYLISPTLICSGKKPFYGLTRGWLVAFFFPGINAC